MYALIRQYWLPIIMVTTVLTRLPFLWTGYGADADAWLVANSASHLWNTGEYHGAPLSNAATLAATLIAIAVWSKISHQTGQHKKPLVIAFAFAPVVWQHSAVTLDYMWSLLFILLSLYAVFRQRILIAGIALGISAGFRPSNFVAIVPLLCLLYLQKQDFKHVLVFVLSAITVSVAAFIPLIVKYGIPGWFVATRQEMSDVLHPPFVMRGIAFFYRTTYFIGPLAGMIAGYVFWKRRDELLASVRSHDPIVVTSLLGIFTFLLAFLWLPLDRAYLLPALPFLLLLVDRLSSQRVFILFTVFLVLSALISVDVIDAKTRRTFGLNVHPGMVIEELLMRKGLH